MLAATALANPLIVPKLSSLDPRAARALMTVTLIGLITAVATLAMQPPKLYCTVLIYIISFTLVGLAVSWRSFGWPHGALRVLGGSACMFAALFVAFVAAFLPRQQRPNASFKSTRRLYPVHLRWKNKRLAFIERQQESYPVRRLCRLFGISASGFL